MAKKYGLIIDITRSDGCGSDILSVADELTAINNAPCDSEIPEGKAAAWMNLREYEQGQGSKIKMDYIPAFFPIEGGVKPLDAIYDDPTMDKIWGDLEDPDSCASKFAAEHKDDITECNIEGEDYSVLYYKMPKPFITGEVANADGSACLKDVKVTLTAKKSGASCDTVTDFFGDFEFLGLDKDEEYVVAVDGAEPVEVVLDAAKDLGTIRI